MTAPNSADCDTPRDVDYTPRQRAALGATPGICRALNPERAFMCELDAGHEGDHVGFELPTVEIDDPTYVTAPGVKP